MKNKFFLIVLVIILSLSLLTACHSETPSAAENPVVTTDAKKPQEQPAAAIPKETPSESKPAEAAKPAETTPKSPEKPTETNNNNKASLQIEGSAIIEPITLSLDELKAMKDYYIEDDFFSLNSYGTKEYFHFKGIKIKAILDKAGLSRNAATVCFVASDGYKQELSLEQALKEDYIDEQNPDKKYPVIIAWHENGEDYDAEKGAPFRLVVGQKEPGDVNKPQWVQNLTKIIVD